MKRGLCRFNRIRFSRYAYFIRDDIPSSFETKFKVLWCRDLTRLEAFVGPSFARSNLPTSSLTPPSKETSQSKDNATRGKKGEKRRTKGNEGWWIADVDRINDIDSSGARDKYEILVTHPVTRRSGETKYGYLDISMSRFLWIPPPHTRRNAGDISFLTCPLPRIEFFPESRPMSCRFVFVPRIWIPFYSPTRGTCAGYLNRFSYRWC